MPEVKPTKDGLLTAYVNKMMKEKGLEGEQYEQLRRQLKEKLEEQVEEAMIRMLSDEQLLELDARLDEGMSDEELEGFFEGAGVNLEAAAEQAMVSFKSAFMASGVGA